MWRKRKTLLGWIVWNLGMRLAKRKAAQNRAKIGAAGVIALVVIGGLIAAKGDNGGLAEPL